MKFITQKKGENFIVSNNTTGMVRGVHKTEAEAKAQAQKLNKTHQSGVEMASAKMIKPKDISEDNLDDDGE